MKVALVYDRVNKWGGAERVLLALHKIFPDAPLYTSVYDKKNAPWADVYNIHTSFLQKIPFASQNHELLAPLMPLAFESFEFDEYDLVISITSEAAKGIVTKPGTVHMCYCLTPTRYLWSGYDDYFTNQAVINLTKPIVNSLRKWDKSAAQRPDVFIGISKEVQARIKKYYERDSLLIYPPLGIKTKVQSKNSKISEGEYYLVVSRLSKFTQYKRVDLAIDAANELKLPLKVIGDGSLKRELERKSGATIEFLGKVTDSELAEYYSNCKALIFPGNEDFGLTMVEAQSFGKPVIAFNSGGARETVINGKTGLLFDEQSKESLVAAIKNFETFKYNPKDCISNAKRFSEENFQKNFSSVVNKLLSVYNK